MSKPKKKLKHQICTNPPNGDQLVGDVPVSDLPTLVVGFPLDGRKKPRLIVSRDGQKKLWLKLSRKVAQALVDFKIPSEEVDL